MLIGDMEIRLRADIARLQRDMDSARQVVGNATNQISRAADAAKAALAGIGAGIGLAQIVQMTDAYAKFTAQLRLASTSAREYAAAYADVKRISTAAQQDLQATGMLYARIANGTRELGTTQKQVAAITETVNMALKVSGATAAESASAQLQLSQAFASGTLRGEEFNAVNEAAPRLMLALADGIGVPVGALKKMAEAGEITSKIMADVLPNALAQLREEAKQVQTISGAFTVLKNNMMEFVGIQANANGGVAALTGAIGLLADNLALVGTAMVSVMAIKLALGMEALTARTIAASAASTAQRAATIAAAQAAVVSAQATVASTAAEVSNLRARAAMIVELRAETLATIASANAVINSTASDVAKTLALQSRSVAMIEVAALGRAGIAVEAALTTATAASAAATTAATVATTGLAATTWGAVIAARALAAAMWVIANPLAALTAAVGIGATAWMIWENRTKESNDKALKSVDETTTEMIARLDKQIDKLKERNRLQDTEPRMKGLSDLSDADRDGLARAKAALDQNRESQSVLKNTSMLQLEEIDLLRNYETALKRVEEAQNEVTKSTARGYDGKMAKWTGENGTAAQKMAYELANLRKEFGQLTPAQEAWVKAKYADKAAATTIKQEATAYQSLITSIGEKIAANKLEMSGYDKLSDAQKMTIKLDEAIASGKNKLTPKHIEEARALIATVAAQDQAIERTNSMAKIQAEYAADIGKSVDAANKEAAAQEELVSTFGMAKSAIQALEVARMEERLERLRGIDMADDEVAALELVIAAKKRSTAASSTLEGLEIAKKAADDAKAAWKKTADSIEQSLTDALMRGFESGKSFGRNLIDTLKNMFSTLVLRPMIQGVLTPASNSIASALGSNGATSGIGGAMNLLSMGKTIYTGFATGLTGSIGTLATQFGTAIGSSTIAGFGGGISAAAGGGTSGAAMLASATTSGNAAAGASAGVGAAGAIPIVGWIAAGMAASNALYKQGWDATNGTLSATGKILGGAILGLNSVLKKFGMSDSLANIFSGQATISKLFGRKNPEVESFGIEGAFGASGFDGKAFQNILEKGGVFRSDKRTSATSALDAGTETSFDDTIKNLMLAVKGFGAQMGIEASQIDGYTKAIKLTLTTDDAKNQELIAGLFGDIGNDLAALLVPSIASLGLAGETTAATLQRVAANYAGIDSILTAIGMSFGAVGTGSLAARERLIGLSGGIDAMAQGAAFFAQNFMTEAERLAPVQAQVTAEMSRLGLAGIMTRDQFKNTVLGLDLTTEKGAETYAALMKIQEAFAMVTPAIETVVVAVRSLSDIANEAASLQDQLDSLTMSPAALAAKARGKIDPSNLKLYDDVQIAQGVKDLAAVNKTYLDQLHEMDRATMTSAQLRADDIIGMDASTIALYDLLAARKADQAATAANAALMESNRARADAIYTKRQADGQAAEQAAASQAQALMTQRANMMTQSAGAEATLFNLTHTSSEQLARARELEIDGMDASLVALQKEIYAKQDSIAVTVAAIAAEDALKAKREQIANEGRGLQREMYQLTGNTIALRKLEVEALAPENRALKESIFAMQDKIAAEQAAAAIQAQMAQAAMQAAEEQKRAAEQLKSAWHGITTSIFDEIARIRGLANEGTPDSLSGAQTKFAIATAQARAGDQDAAKLLPQLSQAMLQIAEVTAVTAFDLRLIQAQTAASLSQTGAGFASQFGLSIPGFASGGDHLGGYRIVGENGPELEATGPSRIFNARQTASMMGGDTSRLEAAVDRLTAKVADQQAALDKAARDMKRLADGMEVVTGGFNAMRTEEQPA